MNRRDVLGLSGTLVIAGLAGCLTDVPGDGGGSGGDSGVRPTLTDSSFEVRETGPGEQDDNRADVSFDDVVTVEGYVVGRNGCYTAELKDADIENDELRVTVRAYEDANGMCTQQLVEIHYEATFEFEDELPQRVVVEHDSMDDVRTVTETAR